MTFDEMRREAYELVRDYKADRRNRPHFVAELEVTTFTDGRTEVEYSLYAAWGDPDMSMGHSKGATPDEAFGKFRQAYIRLNDPASGDVADALPAGVPQIEEEASSAKDN